MKARLAAVILVFALSACVPIQPQEPHTQTLVARGGLSDLAIVFAAWDEHDDASQYMDLIAELDECMSHATIELSEEGFTDQQVAAASIHMLTIMMIAAGLEREELIESGELDQNQLEEFGADRAIYHHLLWAVGYCDE